MNTNSLKSTYQISKLIAINVLNETKLSFEIAWDKYCSSFPNNDFIPYKKLSSQNNYRGPLKNDKRLLYTLIQCIDTGVQYFLKNKKPPDPIDFEELLRDSLSSNHIMSQETLENIIPAAKQIFNSELHLMSFEYEKNKNETDCFNSLQNNIKDVFLSHATEDKEKYVLPLAAELKKREITYWLDEAELLWGDSIADKINEGLLASKYVIVFLSENFFKKYWSRSELSSALNLEHNRMKKVLLPILIGEHKVIEKELLLNSRLYLKWHIGVVEIVNKLEGILQNTG